MAISKLVDVVKLSPNYSAPRSRRIDKITIHHMAGNLTAEQCGEVFANRSRQASSNYGVDSSGRVGLYVLEENRSWASSSPSNDNRAVTIEVANDEIGGEWHVSDAAFDKLIDLCVDICERNNIKALMFTGDANGNLTMHRYFASTTCPGPYLAGRFAEIAERVNHRLSAAEEQQETQQADTYNIFLQAATLGGVLPVVKNNNTNAGDGNSIKYFSAWTDPGYLDVQVYTKASGWLPILANPSNISNHYSGSVGDGSDILRLRMYYWSPKGDKAVYYRVMVGGFWLPWMKDHHDLGGSSDDFAGNGFSPIQRVEAYIGEV